jgi:hypothetical protein
MSNQLIDDPAIQADLSRDWDLKTIRYFHDSWGGPRSAYAWAIGRAPSGMGFLTADLDTQKVEDFIIAFYTAYNAHFGKTY